MRAAPIVTRHPAPVAYLRDLGIADASTPGVTHASDPGQIRDRVVSSIN